MAQQVQQLDRMIIRFVGLTGHRVQLTGDQFTQESAAFGNKLATFRNLPAEICAPQGHAPRGAAELAEAIADPIVGDELLRVDIKSNLVGVGQ